MKKIYSKIIIAFLLVTLACISVMAAGADSEPYYAINNSTHEQFQSLDNILKILCSNDMNNGDRVTCEIANAEFSLDAIPGRMEGNGVKNLDFVFNNCTIVNSGYFHACSYNMVDGENKGHLSMTFNDCNFKVNIQSGSVNHMTNNIDMFFNNCDFNGTNTYLGDTVGDVVFNNCKNMNRINCNNTNVYYNTTRKSADGSDSELTIKNCTFIDSQNDAEKQTLLLYGMNFVNYSFIGNTWENGDKMNLASYSANSWIFGGKTKFLSAVKDADGNIPTSLNEVDLSVRDTEYISTAENANGFYIFVTPVSVASVFHPSYSVPILANNVAYIYGRSETEMKAKEPMLRGEVCSVIYRLMKQNNMLDGYVYDKNSTPSHSELAGRWDRSAIEYLIYRGAYDSSFNIINGSAPITRGEAFKLLCLGLGFTNDTSLTIENYTQILVDEGYVEGDENGNLNLSGNIKRAEFCKVYNMTTGRDKLPLTLLDGTVINSASYNFSDLNEGDWYYEIMLRATSSYVDGYVDLNARKARNPLDDYDE